MTHDPAGIQLPTGFRFAGIHCGIKPEKPDLSLIVADKPAIGFGVFTQNLVRAACIDWNRSIFPSRNLRGVVINSGNANACTGELGQENNRRMAALLASELAQPAGPVDPPSVAVLSTGVIGRQLPMARLETGIPRAARELRDDVVAFLQAAQGILTTDHARKVGSIAFQVAGATYRIAAMAKGAGMIGPNMATMLGVIVTDFPLAFASGQMLLQRAVDRTFNRISVEGHMSTNDAVLLLSSGGEQSLSADAEQRFDESLGDLCLQLAKKIPADGEGASHLIHIRVTGAASNQDADRIARTIALSNLVKTAVAGADPNWGRIVSAAGYAGVPLAVDQMRLAVNGILLFERGQPVPFSEREVSQVIRNAFETEIDLTVGTGVGDAEHWTSDLTADYVKLNAEYTT